MHDRQMTRGVSPYDDTEGFFPYDVMQHAAAEDGLDFGDSSLKLFYKKYITGKLGRQYLKW